MSTTIRTVCFSGGLAPELGRPRPARSPGSRVMVRYRRSACVRNELERLRAHLPSPAAKWGDVDLLWTAFVRAPPENQRTYGRAGAPCRTTESWWRPARPLTGARYRYRAATGEPQRPDSGDELDRHQHVKRLACGAGDAEQGACSRSVRVCLDDNPSHQPSIVGSRCGGRVVMQTRDGRNKQDLARRNKQDLASPQVSDPQCGKEPERDLLP